MSESNDDVESVFKNLSNLERPWRLSLFSFFEATLLPYLVPLSLSLSLLPLIKTSNGREAHVEEDEHLLCSCRSGRGSQQRAVVVGARFHFVCGIVHHRGLFPRARRVGAQPAPVVPARPGQTLEHLLHPEHGE